MNYELWSLGIILGSKDCMEWDEKEGVNLFHYEGTRI